MSQQELLNTVLKTLDQLGIGYMLTGSHASSLYGEVRVTHDIDLVVDLMPEHVPALLDAFAGDRFYLSETAVKDAIRQQRMFNLLEIATAEKVDFWLLNDSEFDQIRFARRQRFDLGEQIAFVSSPEDTILKKLHWCQESGGSEKQFHDVLRVYELQAELLDQIYLQKWVKELGVEDLWQRVLREAEPFTLPDGFM
jgi:hypothetical protein